MTNFISSIWTKRIGCIAVMFAIAGMTGCEREAKDSKSAKPPSQVSRPVPIESPGEAVQESQPAGQEVESAGAGMKLLVGTWVRTDSPYTIEIRAVSDDGKLEAAYYNPNSINVARAEAKSTTRGLEVFIELRDVNYPGSTYTLVYDRVNDVLQGVYFQAAMRESYDVAFTRQQGNVE